jgi:hypothetical protein
VGIWNWRNWIDTVDESSEQRIAGAGSRAACAGAERPFMRQTSRASSVSRDRAGAFPLSQLPAATRGCAPGLPCARCAPNFSPPGQGGLLSLIISPGWTWETYSLYRPGLKPLCLPVATTKLTSTSGSVGRQTNSTSNRTRSGVKQLLM